MEKVTLYYEPKSKLSFLSFEEKEIKGFRKEIIEADREYMQSMREEVENQKDHILSKDLKPKYVIFGVVEYETLTVENFILSGGTENTLPKKYKGLTIIPDINSKDKIQVLTDLNKEYLRRV